ncbi:MAG: Gfo/Idh/MocA family oxidoreductase [Planctomycetes bacterium]|nr:Gfo/Idh/MocA family oxidoreductase [Planctomycetota bacterium]
MAKNVRFGIIGAGMISYFHAKAIQDAEGAELVSVMSPRRPSLDKFLAVHQVRDYDNLGSFLADPELDAVAIATPTGLHRDTAVPAAKAKKHVLCEKPLDINPAKAQEIIDACRDNGVVLAPIFQYRFNSAAILVKRAINAGRFGKLLMANARIKWYRPQSYYDSGAWRGTWELDGGGCLMNQSIHAIDLFLHFAGRPVEVYGYTATAAHTRIEVEDNAVAVVRFDNGAFGVIESSTACEPGWPLEVEISGVGGTARIKADALDKWEFNTPDPAMDAEAAKLMETPAANSGASDPKAISSLGHQKIVEAMVKAIRNGENSVIGGAEAKLPIELICGIYEAVRTGKPAKLS